MTHLLALSPFFWKGIVVVGCAVVLFIGSVYLLLAAVFGVRMGYLVLAVSFFAWMIIFSMIWTFGQPSVLGVVGTPKNEGPRGTEPHWQVFAAGTTAIPTKYTGTEAYPSRPWKPPSAAVKSSVDTVRTAVQKYLMTQAAEQFQKQGKKVCEPLGIPPVETDCIFVDPTTFVVDDVEFATAKDGTHLAAAHSFFTAGGPEVTVYAYHDPGNVQAYSWAFLLASIFGFGVHLPFLDRAEKKRKAILTGGAAPPWFGPA
jgi:hypothetical protein